MRIIPAIDIIGGKCVRLTQGDYGQMKVYREDPLEVAKEFEKADLEYLHLIDLDGAKKGKVVNWEVIEEIQEKTTLKVDFGGGVKSKTEVEQLLDLGINQINVGSLAVRKPDEFAAWMKKFGPENFILSADVLDDNVMINGWLESTKLRLIELAGKFQKQGLEYMACTDIRTDGTMQGPNLDLYRGLKKQFPTLKIIASGGVSSIADLKELKKIDVDAVIIGKAIYEKRIALADFNEDLMLTKRIIPCLDIKDGRTVKGINFINIRDAGDPVELGAAYAQQGADELVFLDISATNEKRKTFAQLVKQIAINVNIPFTVGGGINSIEDVAPLLDAGADKVSINSAAVKNPALIDQLSKAFGSQCIVLAIDAKKTGNPWTVFTHGGTMPTDKKLFSWAKEGQDRGAGEILFTSMDHDGTKNGFAIDPLQKLNQLLDIPVIASGGAGNPAHFVDAFLLGRADAALAASIFHFGEIKIPDLKLYLQQNGIAIRN